jgi:hypothetical protein
MTGTRWRAQAATMAWTSSVVCAKATASGDAPGFHVRSLPCCSRTAADVDSRSPSSPAISAMALSTDDVSTFA